MFQLGVGGARGADVGDGDNQKRFAQLMLMSSGDLSEAPADTISDDGPTDST